MKLCAHSLAKWSFSAANSKNEKLYLLTEYSFYLKFINVLYLNKRNNNLRCQIKFVKQLYQNNNNKTYYYDLFNVCES